MMGELMRESGSWSCDLRGGDGTLRGGLVELVILLERY